MTDLSNQSLSDDRFDGRGQQEAFHAEVGESQHGAGCVIGMQRREHEVTGQRCLNRDLRGLEVSNLTDEDDVGVLTQERTQQRREGQILIGVHLALDEAVDVVFHRVFGRQDLGLEHR